VFASLALTGLTATRLMATDANKTLASVANLALWVAGTSNRVTVANDGDGTITLSGPQDYHTGASPTFAGLTLTGMSGIIKATTGVLSGGGAHADLATVTANQHHNQAHVLDGGDHTVSGLTTGHVLQALTATTFGFAVVPGLHDAVSLAASADVLLGLTGQQLSLDTQTAAYVLAGPTSGGAAAPTFRALVTTDIPALAYDTTGTAAGLLSGHTSTYDHTLLHAAATVTAAPLTLSGQAITFNYDTNDFQLSGNNLQVKDGGIDHGGIGGLADDDHTQYLPANATRTSNADSLTTAQLGNSNAGTSAGARVLFGNNTGSSVSVEQLSSTYTEAGARGPDNAVIYANNTGSLNFVHATDADSAVMRFFIRGTATNKERFRIDSVGVKVGLYGYVGRILSGTATFLGELGDAYGCVGYNLDLLSGAYKYITSDYASRIFFSAGTVLLETAPSGTADTAVTFTTRLTVANTGLVTAGGVIRSNTGFNLNGTDGLASQVVALAKLTALGSDGSITITGGIVTAYTAPT
jgi:hypothetical protein